MALRASFFGTSNPTTSGRFATKAAPESPAGQRPRAVVWRAAWDDSDDG